MMTRLLYVLTLAAFTTFGAQAQIVNFITENFNTGFPSTWTRINVDGLTPAGPVAFVNNAWVAYEDVDSTGLGDSVAVATSYYSPVGTANDWMITPAIILKGHGNRLAWDAKSQDPSYPDGYDILISNTLPVIDSFYSNNKLFFTDFEYPDWTRRNISLDSFAYDTIYIAFRAKSEDQFLLLIDNVNIYADTLLSVNENTTDVFIANAYPNPFSTNVTITSNSPIECLMLVDVSGKTVDYKKPNATTVVLPLEHLQNGIYTVLLTNRNGTLKRLKLIKS